jgi:hypothetical protein
MGVPEPASVRDWRTETAPSVDGTWLVAVTADRHGRLAIIPPGVMTFAEGSGGTSAWRLAQWHDDADTDLRGVAPESVNVLELEQALAMVAPKLRSWVRSEHKQALRHARAAVQRARAASDTHAAHTAQVVVDDLERQDAEADSRLTRTSGPPT